MSDAYMRLEFDKAGNIRFRGLPSICADTLMRLPDILASDDPAVRLRLLPETYRDPQDRDDWRKYAVPGLEHLFADRVEIIARDLVSLAEDGENLFEMAIPAAHRTAWLSALNAARLTLYVEAGLDPEDVELEPGDLEDFDQDVALMRIHLLAFMQEMMLEGGAGFRVDSDEPGGDHQ